MTGLFADARRTAAGAVALLVAAILFTDHGGPGEAALETADSAAHDKPSPAPRRAAPPGGFAAEPTADMPVIAPVAARRGAEPAPVAAGALPNMEPVGPDFPPELRRLRS